ncbi:AAA domain-containing protein [Gordonia sp. ABSL49_1]|uniref:AAA domain-containing protein n=1 Tax=Gordonia sp. ABSL49_1 TaxID=2920941 RepID=UPI001F104C9D|nr:AAA domain-containing protein [Gordonia sp. ABSL49_1]MCH5642271.1 AAA domain-containing protein [Gordonia sp. ABSL49_1]
MELRDRVGRLMQFLREIVKARSAPVLNVEGHERVRWLYSDSTPLNIDLSASAGEVVVRAPRVNLDEPPAVTAALRDWLDDYSYLDNSCSEGPRLRGELAAGTSSRFTSDQAGEAYRRWYETWRRWAQTDRQRRPHAELYQSLSDMRHELKAQPESVELVVASGLLTMPAHLSGGDRVRTHLVTQEATIERDDETGDLLVQLAELTSCRLEDTQLLTGIEMFDQSGSRLLQTQLQEHLSPIDDGIGVFLKAWALRALGADIEIDGSFEPPTETRDLALHVAPALVLRRRGAFALVDYYDRMIAQAGLPDAKTPLGLAQLVTSIEAEDRVEWLESTGATAPRELAEDPLFPLPANTEQAKIIDRLGGDSGVVVEGPPGTGKTHTIANLVSALLARGQRVLVTSEKSQALEVLRGKLPPEMQELCVSITDLARGGSQELNRSVATIAERKTSFIPEVADQTIADLAQKRDQARARRAETLESIRALRESETFQHPEIAPGYSGTLANIVRELESKRSRLAWLPGPVRVSEPPINPDQLTEFAALLKAQTHEHRSRADQYLPSLNDVLPPHGQMIKLFDIVSRPTLATSPRSAELLAIIDSADVDTTARVQATCEELQRAISRIRALPPELQQLADRVMSGTMDHLWARIENVDQYLTAAIDADRRIGVTQVDSPPVSRGALNVIKQWLAKLEAGAEWRGRFRRSDEQKAFDTLELSLVVDGDAVTNAAALVTVVAHLSCLDAIDSARHILLDLGVRFDPPPSRSGQVNALHNLRRQLADIEHLIAMRTSLQREIEQVSGHQIYFGTVDEASDTATAAAGITREIQRREAHDEIGATVDNLHSVFGNAPAPEARELVQSIRSASSSAFDQAVQAYVRAQQQQRELTNASAIAAALRDAAPGLHTAIVDNPDDQWATRADTLFDAWHWRLTSDWLANHRQPGREATLSNELDAATEDIASLTARLAAQRAWKSCLQRMTAREVTALQAYRDHIRSVGKGTGKYAERYRQAAREAMSEAQTAVPAWVMPTQQVLASIPPQPGAFDVVIVDEASQVDITNLYLLWLAPRIIVVGDDKQCTPSEVALGSLDDVFTRLDNYLPDLPGHVRTTFTPRSSLFSLLRSRFGQVVRLREHFRSMPEIIHWSSNQFYLDAPLVPVRQFGSDRLSPLRTTFVPGATVTGKNQTLANLAEARAIADQILACVDDPTYAGKTMGVVVLQGQAQVVAIQNALRGHLSEEEWNDRRFRVGTPPDFQGDERDVVFMSLVVAPEQNFQSLTRTEFEQRFNVGATRAKDQMWLFHSVTIDRLRAGDLRRSLLEYMTSTVSAPADPMPENVSNDLRDSRFDSLFEQRVFNEIVARGYHVNPQVPVNNRRIDLVVTGSASRLAVECDGDAFHTTPDQLRADLEREIELRRCGWTFWRVRESEFYTDPVEAMSGLWDELGALGILPGARIAGPEPGPFDGPIAAATDEEVENSAPARAADMDTATAVFGKVSDPVDHVIRGGGVSGDSTAFMAATRGNEVTPIDDGMSELAANDLTLLPGRGADREQRQGERPSSNDVLAPPPAPASTQEEDQGDGTQVTDVVIRDAVLYNVEKLGIVEPQDLAEQLEVSADRVERIMDQLVADGELLWETEELDEAAEADSDDTVRMSESVAEPSGTAREAETIRRVLVAGAWSAIPMTVERARAITKLDEDDVRGQLAALVAAGELKEQTVHGVQAWVRPQRVHS